MKKLLFGLLFASMGFGATTAKAANWPLSVVGNWSVLASLTAGTLIITAQGSSGDCKVIQGTIFGDPIQGFYCPLSGRIHFLRKNAATNDTFQVYTANLSVPGAILHMGGTFTVLSGLLGEYNFQASK